ncbi:hypothetical protein niasHT_031712 [Heterodera trifolii]|uniref:Fucosyltransferase n=1 Tax=Heterodera trifolii TaxID=157864 RepID=A0ABD2J2Q4_9BILA
MRIISSKSEKHSPKCSAAANGSALAFWSKSSLALCLVVATIIFLFYSFELSLGKDYMANYLTLIGKISSEKVKNIKKMFKQINEKEKNDVGISKENYGTSIPNNGTSLNSGGTLENSFSPIPPKTAPVYEFRYLKWGFDNCSYNCVYTEDRKLELLASAVIFHGGQSLGELPKQRKPEQLFTLMTHESPDLCYPNLANLPANYFNISITYHANSTIYIPYEQFNAITSQTAKEEIWSEDEIMKRMGLKRQLALQIVSHCDASSGRDRLIEQLQQLMPLEVFGRCNQKPCDNNCYQQQLGSHFFYMAFENSVCPQYVTEKFWNALRSLAVPVVLSRSALKGTGIPDEVYIAADDFGSVKELADYLKALRNDTDRYLGYLKWTKKYRKQWDHNTKPTALCQLCEILYKQRLKEEFRSYAVQLDKFWGEKTSDQSGEKVNRKMRMERAGEEAPQIADDEEKHQLQLALELSRKTFMEEEAKRHGIVVESQQIDLMIVEDPAIIQRNQQIEQIKRMMMEQQQQNNGSTSAATPSSSSSSSNPFFLDGSVSSSAAVRPRHFHGTPQIGPSSLLMPQFIAAAAATPSATPQHEQQLFAFGARFVSATPTSPAASAEFHHQQHFVCPNFAPPQPQLSHRIQQQQHFSAEPFSKIHNSFSFPHTISNFVHQKQTPTETATISSSFCCTPIQENNPFGTPLAQLCVHNDEQQSKMLRSVSPPLRVPFRSATFNGDLIDLRSPRSGNSMAIEEFDPLYVKLQQMKTAQKTKASAVVGPSSNSSNEQLHLVDGCSTVPCSSSDIAKANKTSRCNGHASSGECLKKRRASRTAAHRMLSCDDLKASSKLSCDFHKEKKLLADECRKMAIGPSQNVFFLSPVLDYFVIDEDSTIKLLVHQDDTWSRDTPEEPRRLEFTCGARNTSEEILQKVLLDLLTPEAIAQNEGKIPSGEFALKVYGSDEFLVRDVPIGRHPFVGDLLAKGSDVELEVGKSQLPSTPSPNGTTKRSLPAYPTVNAEIFGTFCETLKNHVEKCLANPQDKRLRQPVLQSIKMITTFINNTQPVDLVAAIDMLFSANCAESLANATSCIVSALLRLFRAYCRSALTDFSVVEPTAGDEHAEDEIKVLECDSPTMPIRDSSLCDERLLLNIESVHNIPGHWTTKYKSFYVEVHLMYGTKSYGMCSSSPRTAVTKYHFVNVPLQLWADFDVHISALPREAQLCFIVRGVPLVEENVPTTPNESGHNGTNNCPPHSANSSGYASARCSATSELGGGCGANFGISAHRLASASLPLYNVDGFLLQGRVLMPLGKMDGDLVHPWGPRPLIRQPDELVLIVKCLDYDYRIHFQSIEPGEISAREFSELPQEEQETLQVLVESAVSHHLTDDDKELLWSRRNCLLQMPRAFPLVMASSFSWGPYSLGNIYALLDKWVTLPPAVAIELLLPYFQDRLLRECAVRRWLANASSVFLFDIVVQLVEALRYETFENSALALFLLGQCVRSRRYAFELYWQLQPRILDAKNPSFSARCQLLQQMLLDLGIPCLGDEVAHQHLFLDRLDKVAATVKESSIDGNMNKVLHKELSHLSDELDMRNVRIPIAPAFQCRTIAVADCAIFNSLTKPIKLIINGKRGQFGIIYKAGDDLRQDAVVLQLVRAMNDIWLSEQLDLRMVLFRCLPTGSKKGLIELVPSCKTLREIQIVSSGAAGVFKDEVLNEWLARQNPSEFQYKAALENFRRSCAGWCVATYVLGIGDRHNDNILVTTNGHVFHIDFGKYMGDWQMAAGFKRDRVPFVFTPEMAYVINGGQSSTEHFQRFVDECCQALNLLRKSAPTVLNIMRFLSCSDIPGMSMESVVS